MPPSSPRSISTTWTIWVQPAQRSASRRPTYIAPADRRSAATRTRPQTLIDHAQAIGADLWRFGSDFNYQGDRQQWAYGGRQRRRSGLPYPALRGANQLLNASGVLAALEALEDRLPVSQQAVRQGLLTVELPARFQVLPGRPTTILDVAHNPHAAAVLAENLDNMGFYPVTHAVFGMLRDKDIGAVVARLGDRVDHWHIGSTHGPRGSSAAGHRRDRASRGRRFEASIDLRTRFGRGRLRARAGTRRCR